MTDTKATRENLKGDKLSGNQHYNKHAESSCTKSFTQ